MNVSTAEPSATTHRISNTDGASGAISPTNQRIDAVIRTLFERAGSESFSVVKSSAEAARRHGFDNCANSRLAGFLEDFRASPLRSHYEDRYPACCFLTNSGLLGLMKSLSLWCDLPENYIGAIPPEQLPWLDVFSLSPDDSPDAAALFELCGFAEDAAAQLARIGSGSRWGFNDEQKNRAIIAAIRQFRNSFMVIAPPEAFQTTEDFLTRTRRLAAAVQLKQTTPPDDPLVIRFVRGGALVVAAWGEEAAVLNAAAREFNI